MDLMPKLATFKQSQLGGYIWIALIILTLFTAVMLLVNQHYMEAFSKAFLAYVFHWVNMLEKEISKRNGGKT